MCGFKIHWTRKGQQVFVIVAGSLESGTVNGALFIHFSPVIGRGNLSKLILSYCDDIITPLANHDKITLFFFPTSFILPSTVIDFLGYIGAYYNENNHQRDNISN